MKKVFNFFKKLGNKISNTKIYKFLFVDAVIWKMIISLLLFLISLFVADYFESLWIWYLGLVFLGYTLIIFLIGLIYAWIINPLRRWRTDKKER